MNADRFTQVKAGVQKLIGDQVSDLVAAGAVSAVREDGLPQDWADDVPNLTPAQASELALELDGCEYQWAVSLRGML